MYCHHRAERESFSQIVAVREDRVKGSYCYLGKKGILLAAPFHKLVIDKGRYFHLLQVSVQDVKFKGLNDNT